ncbi:hypothetical protein D3C73_517300 [compost metagenome]
MVEQWKKLDGVVSAMKKQCRSIQKALTAELPMMKFRHVEDEAGDIGSNLGMILPSAEAAQTFIQTLNAENIGTYILYGGKPVYAIPQLFQQKTAEKDNFPFNYPFKKPVVYTENMCPRAVDLIPRTVFLPVSPLLSEQDVQEIVEGIVKVYKQLFEQV